MVISIIDKAIQQLFKRSVATKILWSNASPASTLKEQNLPMDLSAFDLIAVEYAGIGDDGLRTVIAKIKNGKSISMVAFANSTNASKAILNSRAVTPSGSYLKVGDNYLKYLPDTAAAVNNNYNIPQTIYGIILSGGGYCLGRLLTALRRLLQGGGVCYGN